MTQGIKKIDLRLSSQEDAIKQIICKNASDDEFAQFINVTRNTGLNPYLKEIYWLPRIGPYISHKGMLKVAKRSVDVYDGMRTTVFYKAKDGEINTTYTGDLFMARCEVFRKDRSHPDVFEAFFEEYKRNSPTWNQYPRLMLVTKAEKGALEKSFPVDGVNVELTRSIDDDVIPDLLPATLPSAVSLAPPPPTPQDITTSKGQDDLSAMGLRGALRALLVKIKADHLPDSDIDTLTTKALKTPAKFGELDSLNDVGLLKNAVDYCEVFLARYQA